MADEPGARSLMDEWKERQYMAYVNFLRKKDLFEDWKIFKSGKGQQDQYKLMLDFLIKKDPSSALAPGRGRAGAPR